MVGAATIFESLWQPEAQRQTETKLSPAVIAAAVGCVLSAACGIVRRSTACRTIIGGRNQTTQNAEHSASDVTQEADVDGK
ncbi:MAG: hypothetical protein RIK87_08885 [Fuerstiella sp.]